MTDDYTLVIPTFNRPRLLAALLRFLEDDGADFPILLLDSSHVEHRQRNRALAAGCRLGVEIVEYAVDTHPFDKFRDGIERIRTPLGSLCADDDLVLVSGIHRSVAHLRRHPDVAVAHGYYFSFLDQGPAGFDLTSMLYFTAGIDDGEPLARVRALLRSYQALTYGVYRTPVLRRVMTGIRAVESLFARELLSGTLSVVQGKVARLPCFYGGRSHNPSEQYTHWHPLEWLITDPHGFLDEYVRYREVLLRALAETPANSYSAGETERLIDLMHAFYVSAHAPRQSHEFILDHALAGHDLPKFWADPAIQQPLAEAHWHDPAAAGAGQAGRSGWRWPSRVTAGVRRALERGRPEPPAVPAWPRTEHRGARDYRMHKNFLDFEPRDRHFTTEADLARLLGSLDHYDVEASPPLGSS